MEKKKKNELALTAEEKGRFDLFTRAQNGDSSAVAAVREELANSPRAVELFGNMGRRVEETWCGLMAGENLLYREAFAAKIAAMKSELLGAHASPLERLCVDRIVLCWVQVAHADLQSAQSQSMSLAVAMFHQKRQSMAQRRYLSAIKALAEVRRLLIPAIQVNIADKQVNVV